MNGQDDALYPFANDQRCEELLHREAEALGLTLEQAKAVYTQMSIYIHGLAVLRAVQRANYTPEEMAEMIRKNQEMILKAVRA